MDMPKKGMKKLSLPIWIYLVVVGVFVSAFMAIKTAREEREIEKEWIEKEGEIFIERMEEEKERRGLMKETGNS